ncbi:ZIP-like iron-zinc transporter [Serendipita vermifera]|nr:ZIP-like iron-zinc transporter [Serendipita vermifera]
MSEESSCTRNVLGNQDTQQSLRVAAIFIILASSAIGAFFPLIAKQSMRLPTSVYEFAKYFGSGVIIATAFIHLLTPGFEALGNPCLSEAWHNYPWPAAISMTSVFFIFFIELLAFRWGTARLKRLNGGGMRYDPHGHAHGPEGLHAAHGPEPEQQQEQHVVGDVKVRPSTSAHGHAPLKQTVSASTGDLEANQHHHHHSHTGNILDDHPLAQILSVLILEFGIIFHSFITGITLAVSADVIALLIVLTFHQLFEGLGLGTRLAHLTLFTSQLTPDHDHDHDGEPKEPTDKKRSLYSYFPWFGALAFALTTPLGIAVGLGLRNAYDPESTTESIVSGIFDSFSSGILLYAGLVELLAHEFLFSKTMRERPAGEVAYAGACVLLGAGLMALLGRWA